jgi:V/A-type H+-transporting ATPase subunit F
MLGYVIGDSDMITGFKLVGVEGTEVNSADEARQALNKAVGRNDLAIIIISEEFSTQPEIHEEIEKIRRERKNTLIVELPGSKGKPSQVHMSDLISKTLGVRI